MIKKDKSDSKRNRPINLHPANPKEVLAALLKTPPPTDDSQVKEPDPKDSAPQ